MFYSAGVAENPAYVYRADQVAVWGGVYPDVVTGPGPSISGAATGMFWALGAGDPAPGQGADSGTQPALGYWLYQGSVWEGDHYPSYISGFWSGDLRIDGCIDATGSNPNGADTDQCLHVLLNDEDGGGTGYFGLVSARPNSMANYDLSTTGQIILQPIPTPLIVGPPQSGPTYMQFDVALSSVPVGPDGGLYLAGCGSGPHSFRVYRQNVPQGAPPPGSRDLSQGWEPLGPVTPVGDVVQDVSVSCSPGESIYLAVSLVFDSGFELDLGSANGGPVPCDVSCTDGDGDGYCADQDCDDANPHCRTDCTDQDGDTWCRDVDCYDMSAACTEDCLDFDEDGVPTCAPDCDETNPHCGVDCTDTDGDGFCVTADCDDSQAACTTPCTDFDDDGLAVCQGDCNDADPRCGMDCADADGDGFCVTTDCDEANPRCGMDCADADRDGFCVTTDCDDTDAFCTTCADPVTVVPFDGSRTAHSRAPIASFKWSRTNYLITAEEMAASGVSGPLHSIGWVYLAASGVGQALAPLKIYLEQTTDVVNNKPLDWAAAISTMTLVHDAVTWLPDAVGPFDIPFANGSPFTFSAAPGQALYVAFDWGEYTGTLAPFLPPGELYVACNSTSLVAGCHTGQSNVTQPSEAAAVSSFRAATRLSVAVCGACTDVDGDGFCAGVDCDDTRPSCTLSCADQDGDGTAVCQDECDDTNPHCQTDCTDADADGWCVTSDCDDLDPTCTDGSCGRCRPPCEDPSVLPPQCDGLCPDPLEHCTFSPALQRCACRPLAVSVDSFTAQTEGRGAVRLRWSTVAELDSIGFRVLRAQGRLQPVAVSGLIPARGTQLEGAQYEFLDTGRKDRGSIYTYFLEDIDGEGRVTRSAGPVVVQIENSRRGDAGRRSKQGAQPLR